MRSKDGWLPRDGDGRGYLAGDRVIEQDVVCSGNYLLDRNAGYLIAGRGKWGGILQLPQPQRFHLPIALGNMHIVREYRVQRSNSPVTAQPSGRCTTPLSALMYRRIQLGT